MITNAIKLQLDGPRNHMNVKKSSSGGSESCHRIVVALWEENPIMKSPSVTCYSNEYSADPPTMVEQ
ncbi:hypothetical protein SLA2020_158040 [Shorea laevis]